MTLIRAIVSLVALGLAIPAGAAAHAVVESTDPPRGAQLERAPERVTFRFNESVEASFGAVRVYDGDGGRVDTGELIRPGDSPQAIGVALEPELGDGTYTATYRVVSADSHPISGGFAFTVGDPTGAATVGVEELIEDAGAGPVTDAAFGVIRVLTYASTALLLGGVAFLVWCWSPALAGASGAGSRWRGAADAFGDRLRALLAVGLAVGFVATALGIVLQGALGLGASFWDALAPGVIGDVLETRFGTAWALRLLDLGLLAALLFAPAIGLRYRILRPASLGAGGFAPVDPLPANPIAVATLGLALGFLALVPALGGHPGVTDPTWLSIGSNFIHVLAFAIWVGGLAALLFALPVATRALEPPQRSRLMAAVLERFSAIALGTVAALLATGIAQAVVQLDALGDLVDTGYGRALLVKAALLALLIGLGAFNRRRSVPAIERRARDGESPGPDGAALRRTIRAELGLIAGVLVATAVLAATAPTAATSEGPYAASADLGPASLELTVDPATAGSNQLHFYLFDSQTGAQYDAAKEFTASASLPAEQVGPLELDARKSGPGHYVVRDAALGVPGDWTLDLVARVSAFDQYETAVQVPIR